MIVYLPYERMFSLVKNDDTVMMMLGLLGNEKLRAKESLSF